MNPRTLLLAGLLFVSSDAAAQWSFNAGLSSAYDSNPLGINETDASSVSSFEAGLSYWGGNFAVGYDGTFTTYSTLDAFEHYFQEAFAVFGTDTTNAGIQFEQRIPTTDNTYAYYRAGAYAQHLIGLGPANLTLQAYAGSYRFQELTERNQYSGGGSARLVRWFQTGTTFVGDAGAQYTLYPDVVRYSPMGSQDDPSVLQWNWGVRLAQSLTEVTGLALQYRQQILNGSTLEQVSRPSGTSYAIIDDPSIYGSQTFGLELTRLMLQRSLTLKVGAYTTRREYEAQGVYQTPDTYDPSVKREDRNNTLWLTAVWTPRLQVLGNHQIDLKLGAQWTDNDSNSYWYRYGNEFISLGLGYRY